MKYTVKEIAPLLDFLLKAMGTSSKTKIRNYLQYGYISVNGTVVKRADTPLFAGQTVEVNIQPDPKKAKPRHQSSFTRQKAPFPVLYEDQYIIALEKPSGLLSIGTDREKTKTFFKMVSQYVKDTTEDQEKIFIVHRLDREVSGVMIFAKSEEIKEALQSTWDSTEKIYLALVEGHPREKEGTVQNWLRENTAKISYVAGKDVPGAQWAVTHYRVLKTYPRNTLLEVRIETGRKHQIRVHLAGLGCPIVGDKKYGASGSPIRRLGLHAFSLEFTHPVTNERIRLEAPTPSIFAQFGKHNRD